MSSFELSQRLLRYPLDLTGSSPDNYVEAEVCNLPTVGSNRAVVLSNGSFYTESIVVYDNTTGERLDKKVHYLAVQLVAAATVRSGKEICSVLVITDPSVSNQIRVDYQAVGGPYILNTDALVDMIDALDLDERPITWGSIIGKPDLFPAGHHLHDAGDVFGFEYLVLGIEEIRKAIIMGDIASHDEIYAYITDRIDYTVGLINDLDAVVQSHLNNVSNPHSTTKAQVGLGSVENYGIATQLEAEVGTATNKYMTPQRVKEAITSQAISVIQAHMDDTNNPHSVTKAQVGLGSVVNYAIATQAEAEAGVVTNKYMTPLLVKQAIDKQALIPLNTHINDKTNPHSTTKAQVGLGSVENYPVATKAEAETGTATNRYMTPLRVAEAIAFQAGTMLQAHIDDKTNPHSVTKTQVGLSSVQNYGIASQAEAEAGVSNIDYMTPLRVAQEITALATTPIMLALNTHAGLTNNPHSVTKTQVGLGSVVNYPIATDTEATARSAVDKYITCRQLGLAFGGLGNAAFMNTGIGSTNVATGNHTHTTLWNGTKSGVLDGSGNFTVPGDLIGLSDARLKRNWTRISNALERVKMLEGGTFQRLDSDEWCTGLLAQAVQKAMPEAAHTTPEGYLSVAYGNLVGLLVEAIKDLSDQVETLRNDN